MLKMHKLLENHAPNCPSPQQWGGDTKVDCLRSWQLGFNCWPTVAYLYPCGL